MIKVDLQLFAYAGKKALIKVSGAAVAFVGEATTAAVNLTYQITNTLMQILDYASSVIVYKFLATSAATTGTTTTTLIITAHGLTTGDLIINTTRANAKRTVTVVDANTLTVAAVTGQVSGDSIGKYTVEPSTGYTVDKVSGTIIYPTALSRTILVSGNYLPVSTAAECKEYSITITGEMKDTSKFQDEWTSKTPTLLSCEGSLSRWLTIDTYFYDALTSGNPVVIEMYANDTLNPDRVFAILNSVEMSAAVDGANEEAVSFESTDKMLASYV